MNKWTVLLAVFCFTQLSSFTNNFAQAQQQLPGVVVTADAPFVDFNLCAIIIQACQIGSNGGGGMPDPGGGGSTTPVGGGSGYQLTPMDYLALNADPGLVATLQSILKNIFSKLGLGNFSVTVKDGMLVLYNISNALEQIYNDPEARRLHNLALAESLEDGQMTDLEIGKKVSITINGVTFTAMVWVHAVTWQLQKVVLSAGGDIGTAFYLDRQWTWAISLYHRSNGGSLPPGNQ